MNLLPKFLPRSTDDREAEVRRNMIRHEAKIGATLFGPIPAGHSRSFFCLDEHTWIWHEEWQQNGQRKAVTTRYELRPNGIIKSQGGQAAQMLGATEAQHLRRAVELYYQKVTADYQRQLQVA